MFVPIRGLESNKQGKCKDYKPEDECSGDEISELGEESKIGSSFKNGGDDTGELSYELLSPLLSKLRKWNMSVFSSNVRV
jgi:hypothetical protein